MYNCNVCRHNLQLLTSAIIAVHAMLYIEYVLMYFYMMKVIVSLREQRERNTPLLRMLSYNIVKYNIALNLKQCATLLYSLAVLNFPDRVRISLHYIDIYERKIYQIYK